MDGLIYGGGLYDGVMGGISCWLKMSYWLIDKCTLRARILDGSMSIGTLDSWRKTPLWTIDVLRRFWMVGVLSSCSIGLYFLLGVGRGGLRIIILFCLDLTMQSRDLTFDGIDMVVCMFNRDFISAWGDVSKRCLGLGGYLDMIGMTGSCILIMIWRRRSLIVLWKGILAYPHYLIFRR